MLPPASLRASSLANRTFASFDSPASSRQTPPTSEAHACAGPRFLSSEPLLLVSH